MTTKPAKKNKQSGSEGGGAERRRGNRREVLETFHVFLVIPKIGLRKLYLKDLSEFGVGFLPDEYDLFKEGSCYDAEIYINPSLKLPLPIKIARVTKDLIGCEFTDTNSKAYAALVKFVVLLDELSTFVA